MIAPVCFASLFAPVTLLRVSYEGVLNLKMHRFRGCYACEVVPLTGRSVNATRRCSQQHRILQEVDSAANTMAVQSTRHETMLVHWLSYDRSLHLEEMLVTCKSSGVAT